MSYAYKAMKTALALYKDAPDHNGRPRDNFGKMMDYFQDIGDAIGIKLSCWSMYDECVNMFDPYPDQSIRTVVYRNGWEDGSVAVVRHFFDDVTLWADMWIAAEHLIDASGDRHHVFVEDFVSKGNDGDVAELWTGS